MESRHRVVVGDAREMDVEDDAVELVVTSPPYPMIEMWDDQFAELSADAADALAAGDGAAAFDAMHEVLTEVWREVKRVLVPGGIACVNVGDATRKVDDSFRVYQNHARIVEAFAELGFEPLPDILWRKPTNSAAKFMGSGMIPPNAYVTLEHEYVLVFRNGSESRGFDPGDTARYESAYFWEERNRWFSDVWTDVTGTSQRMEGAGGASSEGGDSLGELRERSAAYPFAVPYRLINMYSVYGDTVLDPFWGTGTTSLAAMVAGRNSVGVELEAGFADAFGRRAADAPALSRKVATRRLDDHREFVARRREEGEELGYESETYDFPVTTKQEQSLTLYVVDEVTETDEGYRARHEPLER
ncbi:DNA-methyltransferase [Halopelagius longus]|uniref:Type II methyltransferase n=1 Tax=Halopelagius longus TaxID=1236180 RepID=A0A1H0YU33_9EURY|nr:site-specific DNA-methyltransferase [Halopelagius longus]RDI72679.1 site-specific DNA-methyltransferase [Halopelagius longus]SDQ18673.1 DNA modification methylase [Halopelagius longus]